MTRGVHGEKIVATYNNEKLPDKDKLRVEEALKVYDKWVEDLENTEAETLDDLIIKLVDLLNEYKLYIDLNLIYDSEEDFLYRQKGQLKLDNTVMEEFLPILIKKCMEFNPNNINVNIDSQVPTFSSIYFNSSMENPGVGGNITIKTKNQDFSISRKLYIKSSYSPEFENSKTKNVETNIGYVLAELKTNLDKTMYQEASATAHDVKLAVSGSKYFLLCDFLDMTPISTATTDIDEILILRKAKRLHSGKRRKLGNYEGRKEFRDEYEEYLLENPYSTDVFKRFVNHILEQSSNEKLDEDIVLEEGFF